MWAESIGSSDLCSTGWVVGGGGDPAPAWKRRPPPVPLPGAARAGAVVEMLEGRRLLSASASWGDDGYGESDGEADDADDSRVDEGEIQRAEDEAVRAFEQANEDAKDFGSGLSYLTGDDLDRAREEVRSQARESASSRRPAGTKKKNPSVSVTIGEPVKIVGVIHLPDGRGEILIGEPRLIAGELPGERRDGDASGFTSVSGPPSTTGTSAVADLRAGSPPPSTCEDQVAVGLVVVGAGAGAATGGTVPAVVGGLTLGVIGGIGAADKVAEWVCD